MITNMSLKQISWVFISTLVITAIIFIGSGIASVNNIAAIQDTWEYFEDGRSEKDQALNSLRRELGYNGMIHHFKNFILRQEPRYATRVHENIGGALSTIRRYKSFGTNKAEESALNQIKNVIRAYDDALITAIQMSQNNTQSTDIDRAVRVDDKPALEGLKVLEREISASNARPYTHLSKPEIINAICNTGADGYSH